MKNKILIVDDELPLLNALVDKFSGAGFSVITAENGQDGLKSALKNKPDLILLDIIMPVMDGNIMLEKLRKDPWGKNVKVIMLTNLSDPGTITKSAIKTEDDYLIKADWKIEDIVLQVKNILKE